MGLSISNVLGWWRSTISSYFIIIFDSGAILLFRRSGVGIWDRRPRGRGDLTSCIRLTRTTCDPGNLFQLGIKLSEVDFVIVDIELLLPLCQLLTVGVPGRDDYFENIFSPIVSIRISGPLPPSSWVTARLNSNVGIAPGNFSLALQYESRMNGRVHSETCLGFVDANSFWRCIPSMRTRPSLDLSTTGFMWWFAWCTLW